MRPIRWGVVGVLGLAMLGLTGCQSKAVFHALCTSNPVGHDGPGRISGDIDTPLQVHPGDTFALTVKSIGVELDTGLTGDPPPARTATLTISGGAQPSGDVTFGSSTTPAAWPVTVSVTVTGQPGETIDIRVSEGQRIVGPFPSPVGYVLDCRTMPDEGRLVSMAIVAPA